MSNEILYTSVNVTILLPFSHETNRFVVVLDARIRDTLVYFRLRLSY